MLVLGSISILQKVFIMMTPRIAEPVLNPTKEQDIILIDNANPLKYETNMCITSGLNNLIPSLTPRLSKHSLNAFSLRKAILY